MRGPHDDTLQAQEARRDILSVTAEGQRPAGGKVLERLLALLASEGHGQYATAVVEAAVPEEAAKPYLSRIEKYPAAPGAGGVKRTEDGSVLPMDNMASEFLALASPPTGPPGGPGPQWRNLGPFTIPNGQTYGASRVNVSGRVAAIAIDPGNPAHVLCGAANGGVWESFDRGASWAPRTDYAATTTVGAIAFDPSNPTTVYCGTGEGNWWSWLGVGVLRSTDRGTTWATLCTNPFVGQGFYDLRVDAADGRHLLAGTTAGLFVSTDGGLTWTQRRNSTTWAIAMAPAGGPNAEILAACRDGLFRSTDGGTTWAAVALPGSTGSFDRIAVSIAPSNPSVAYAWASQGGTPKLWRRSGRAWAAVTLPSGGVATNQAWYDWYVAAAPDIDTEVYIGAIDAYRGDLSGTTWTWTDISSKSSGQSIHPDQHAIAFEPGNPNMIYAGNDGGLYKSPDRGITWQSCNNGLTITEFEYIAQNVGSSRWVMGGTQDNGTDRWTGSASFDHVADGDGGFCCVNHDNPLIVFHTYYGMSPEVSTTGGNFGSWNYIPPPLPAGEGSPFYPPMRCSDTNGNTLAIAGQALYITMNNGGAWTRLAFPAADSATAVDVPDADDVYVGTGSGKVYHTHWNGSSWSALSAVTSPRNNASLSDLLVTGSRIWATYSTLGGGRVFRSDDSGAHWADCSAGLPNLPVNAIEIDSRNGNRVWVAMDRGVYQSWDAGAHWADFSNGLPNCYIGDLAFHPHAWVLRAGTRNRGLWEIPVDGWMTVPVCGVQWNGTLAANQTMRWFTFNWPATWHVIWTVMPTTIGTAAQLTWSVQVERASAEFATYWITVQNLTAATVNFEGRFEILSRY